jgi:hypothetical protein
VESGQRKRRQNAAPAYRQAGSKGFAHSVHFNRLLHIQHSALNILHLAFNICHSAFALNIEH